MQHGAKPTAWTTCSALARNDRLEKAIVPELITATIDSIRTGKTASPLQGLPLHHPGQLEPKRTPGHRQGGGHGGRGQSARFVVTSLKRSEAGARHLYEKIYCARGDMGGEPHQGVPARPVRRPHPRRRPCQANQLRLWFSPPWPTYCCADCAVSAWRTPSSPRPPAARSGWKSAEAGRLGPRRQRAADQDRDGVSLPMAGRQF